MSECKHITPQHTEPQRKNRTRVWVPWCSQARSCLRPEERRKMTWDGNRRGPGSPILSPAWSSQWHQGSPSPRHRAHHCGMRTSEAGQGLSPASGPGLAGLWQGRAGLLGAGDQLWCPWGRGWQPQRGDMGSWAMGRYGEYWGAAKRQSELMGFRALKLSENCFAYFQIYQKDQQN